MVDHPRVSIVGGTGYVGAELVRLVSAHPLVSLGSVSARAAAGERLADSFAHLAPLGEKRFEAFDPQRFADEADLVFLALPHATSAEAADALLSASPHTRVVDLSADFRLHDQALYEQWYGSHPHPERLGEAVYGLPELHREAIGAARLVACPGCYPTATLLAAIPLVEAGLVDGPIIVDCKSGVSGAGRGPKQGSLYCEAGEQIAPYAVAAHRHSPEIAQELGLGSGHPQALLFTPHLVPMSRGILATVYLPLNDAGLALAKLASAGSDAGLRALYAARYADELFVSFLPEGRFPGTAAVRGSNASQVNVVWDAGTGTAVAMAVIDNLGKGAAGQAIQCMNLQLGLDEAAGLSPIGVFP